MYKDISDDIYGWFSDFDKAFYCEMFEKVPNEGIIVEIGSFKGRSSAYMAFLIAESEKEVAFFCVDTWEGSPEHQEGSYAEDKDVVQGSLYQVFKTNMEPFKEYYVPIQRTSTRAAELFNDNEIDFVFIDADHSYESVVEDIKTWLPKVKKGGIIAGHDYPFPSVNAAVYDTLGYVDFAKGGCWGKIKE